MPDPITDDLLRFIEANVESVDQLEILRVLGEAPEKPRIANDLARECQIQLSAISGQLAALEQRGLVKVQVHEAQVVCRYAPNTDERARLLSRLLQYYKERPVTLIKLVYQRTDERLKAFAEAFRLRKES